MKKIGILCAIMVSTMPLHGKILSFISPEFNQFIAQVVPAAEQNRFSSYHTELNKKINAQNEAQQRKVRYNMYQTALSQLNKEHHVWAEEIKLFLSDLQFFDAAFDKERDDIRQFLYWYGSYGEFQQRSSGIVARNRDGDFLKQVKQRVTQAAHKVGDWFRSWRHDPIAPFTAT